MSKRRKIDPIRTLMVSSSELHCLAELLAHINMDFATDAEATYGLSITLARISKSLRRLNVQLDEESVAKSRGGLHA